MARTKATPVRREVSEEYYSQGMRSRGKGAVPTRSAKEVESKVERRTEKKEAGVLEVAIAVGGIYASFLTWGYLQEKLTTTPHGPPDSPEVFRFPVVLNTIQSAFAAATGLLYLVLSTPANSRLPPVIPSRGILGPLLLVATTSSLASPFGYASLAHIDYVTFLLAKSCKLLPVMLLHVTLFRRKYPLYKYLVVAAVTAGVAVFTLHGGKRHTPGASGEGRSVPWGLLLLGINLLFDGLTNSTQDYVFRAFAPYSGPQMMVANNVMGTLVTGGYLVVSPWLAGTGVGKWLGVEGGSGMGELGEALGFLGRYPGVWRDVLGFAACGAVGQVFIFYTLATFSSVLLVTVTVTRKMFTMMLSVVAFGHRLSGMQWLGVGLVFGGIGAEAMVARREKMAREAAKAK